MADQILHMYAHGWIDDSRYSTFCKNGAFIGFDTPEECLFYLPEDISECVADRVWIDLCTNCRKAVWTTEHRKPIASRSAASGEGVDSE